MKNGKEFAEKMFSEMEDNNEIQEKLYSTGNDELDDLLERAFCEGYEYAQREFAEKEEKKKGHTAAKVAAGVGGTAVVGAGGVWGAEKLGKHLEKTGEGKIMKGAEISGRVDNYISRKGVNKNKKAIDAAINTSEKLTNKGKRNIKTGQNLQKPMKYVREVVNKLAKK